MKALPAGKNLLHELLAAWEELLHQLEPASEVAYRLTRLHQTLAPLADRLYLKTVRGRELLLDCQTQTAGLKAQLAAPDLTFFRRLTTLEDTVALLQREVHEFRVKAG